MSGVRAYLNNRFVKGDTPETIIADFGVEAPWLSNWLSHRHQDSAALGLDALSALIEEWVATRRELTEAEFLCCAAIRGDAPKVEELLAEKEGPKWDSEDRFGVTAGEYALYLGHTKVLELLVKAGVGDYVSRFRNILSSTTASPSAESCAERPSWNYLSKPAKYDHDGCLLDGERMPVMMPWEGILMEATARCLVGPRVLNVGFGCGLVDGFIQKHVPTLTSHVIIEPHPDVLAKAESLGWPEKKGVRVLPGTWQQVLPQQLVASPEERLPSASEASSGGKPLAGSSASLAFDSVFYDTHDEGVAEFIRFARLAASVLSNGEPDGAGGARAAEEEPSERSRPHSPRLFSFWNGMEFHNAFRHGVYCQSVRTFLCEGRSQGDDEQPGGLEFERVDFVRVPVSQGDNGGHDWRVWAGKGMRYWHLNAYYLPLCWKRAPPPPRPPPSSSSSCSSSSSSSSMGSSLESPCVTERADLCEWMVAGIEKGLRYHGIEIQNGPAEIPLEPVDPARRKESPSADNRASVGGECDRPRRAGASSVAERGRQAEPGDKESSESPKRPRH